MVRATLLVLALAVGGLGQETLYVEAGSAAHGARGWAHALEVFDAARHKRYGPEEDGWVVDFRIDARRITAGDSLRMRVLVETGVECVFTGLVGAIDGAEIRLIPKFRAPPVTILLGTTGTVVGALKDLPPGSYRVVCDVTSTYRDWQAGRTVILFQDLIVEPRPGSPPASEDDGPTKTRE